MKIYELLALYATMARIRAFEDAAERASKGGVAVFGAEAGEEAQVRGPLHLSTGQEAVAAGVCFWLKPGDYITSTHRGHGHTLAKGMNVNSMMAELFGRAGGSNGGKGGSMHIADLRVGVLGANGIVAAGIPIAVGAAQAIKIRGGNQIVVCFFGDGAINRGPFLEGLNWACVYQLPVLFVCEDNRYAATTQSALMTGGRGAAARARSIGLPAMTVDGNNVIEVARVAKRMIRRIRAQGGPQFLHAFTYRQKGHVSVDQARYRDPEETKEALLRDPFMLAEAEMARQGIDSASLAAIRTAAAHEIATAVATAQDGPCPQSDEAFCQIQDCGAGTWY